MTKQLIPQIDVLVALGRGQLGEMDRADVEEDVDRAVSRIEDSWRAAFTPAGLRQIAGNAGMRIANFHRRALTRVFQRETGQASIGEDPGLNGRLSAFAGRNSELVSNAVRDHMARIRQVISGGITGGRSIARIIADVRKTAGTLRRRVTNIARDQAQKLVGQLQRTRLRVNGVTEFEWVTQGDDDVRDLHESIDGQRFPISRGHPTEGFPGEPINCRCFMNPIFNR